MALEEGMAKQMHNAGLASTPTGLRSLGRHERRSSREDDDDFGVECWQKVAMYI